MLSPRYTAHRRFSNAPQERLPVPSDPQPERVDSLQHAELQQILVELTAAGLQPWVLGQTANALVLARPLPRFLPLQIAISGPPPPLFHPDLQARLQWHLLDPKNPDALQQLLAQAPIRAHAVALSAQGQVCDPLDGMSDARDRRLRLTGDPRQWFAQGPEHVMVLAVMAAQTGLIPDKELLRLARRDAGNVLSVPREIWADRFGQVLLGEFAGTGLQFLFDCEALQRMVPEVCLMVDFHRSCPVHHKDIWDHTLQVVEKCPQSLTVRWTALMHDSGKVWTRSVNKQGKVHFFRHEELGASLMEGVAARFHLDPDLRDRVVYVIGNHARANVYAADWTDSAVRRLIRDMGDHLDDVLAFSQSDFTTKRQWRIAEVRGLAEDLHKRIRQVAAEDAKIPPLPKGLGHVIMQATGLQPGPWLGQVQRWLESEVENQKIAAQLDAETYLLHLQTHAPELLQVQKGQERQRVR